MAAPAAGGIGVDIDAREWYRLSQEIKKFDPKLMTELRKRMRNAGNTAVERIRAKLAESSPDGGPDEHVMRDILARGTKVTLSFSKSSAGVRIATSGAQLPHEHRPVLKVYNKETFRHPVFGQDDVWVTQRGRPYFDQAFDAAFVREAQREIEAAIRDALAVVRR